MKEYLYFKNIYKKFQENDKDKTVLENISFAVDRGEFAAVLGPSGCGKTTLLKIAAGFLEAEKGAVYLEGEKVIGAGPERIMIFQEFNQLFPWKTIQDNIIFALKAKNIGKNYTERRKIAQGYLAKVQLSDFSEYYPHQLSGGMKQRTALARALAADPEILLMDEPFGSLDSQTRNKLQKLLLDIWQAAKKTILFVTHDIEEAVLLADKIIVMENNPGRIKKVVKNNLKRPRRRADTEFARLYENISNIS